MAVLGSHIDFYRRIFELPGFLAGPVLTLGFQDIVGDDLPEDFRGDLTRLLAARGISDVTTLDLFDGRADLRYDLNLPVPGRNTSATARLSISARSSTCSTRASASRTACGWS